MENRNFAEFLLGTVIFPDNFAVVVQEKEPSNYQLNLLVSAKLELLGHAKII